MSRSAFKDIERAIDLLGDELANVNTQIVRLEQTRRDIARGRMLRVSVTGAQRAATSPDRSRKKSPKTLADYLRSRMQRDS